MEINNFKNIPLEIETSDVTCVGLSTEGVKRHRPKPPSKSYIEMTRKKRIYEAKMIDIVIEIVSYLFYLFLCLLITYGHRDPDAYKMTQGIENIFYQNKFNQVTFSIGSIINFLTIFSTNFKK